MNYPLCFLSMILISSFLAACEQGNNQGSYEVAQEQKGDLSKGLENFSNKSPMTKQDLEDCLRELYGEIEQMQSWWAMSDGRSRGKFAYRLPDASTIKVDGYATEDLGFYVDPSIDCSVLEKERR